MGSRWEQVVVDAEDPARLARWWAEALDYRIVHEEPDEVEIRRTPDETPGILFTAVPEAKSVKNRLHLDVNVGGPHGTPEEERRQRVRAAVDRLVAAGATEVEERSDWSSRWVVMLDPEGNEFCVQPE